MDTGDIDLNFKNENEIYSAEVRKSKKNGNKRKEKRKIGKKSWLKVLKSKKHAYPWYSRILQRQKLKFIN